MFNDISAMESSAQNNNKTEQNYTTESKESKESKGNLLFSNMMNNMLAIFRPSLVSLVYSGKRMYMDQNQRTYIPQKINNTKEQIIDLNIIKFNEEFPNINVLSQYLNENKIKVNDGKVNNVNACGITGAFFIMCVLKKLPIQKLNQCESWKDTFSMQMLITSNNDKENYLNNMVNSNLIMSEENLKIIGKKETISYKIGSICQFLKQNCHTIIVLNDYCHYLYLVKYNNIIALVDSFATPMAQQINNERLTESQINSLEEKYSNNTKDSVYFVPLLPFDEQNKEY